jgi:acyl dehydratase
LTDSNSTRPHTGKWFEELTPGLVIPHAIRRTLTESDNVSFTTMTMNPAWLHLDFDYAKNETEFGRPLVNSMLTVAVVIGISVHETTLGTTVANLGFREVTFPAPVFHGDTIRVETEVLERRASKSRPTQGIVTFEHRAYNQSDVCVCRAVRDALMHLAPAKAPAQAPAGPLETS